MATHTRHHAHIALTEDELVGERSFDPTGAALIEALQHESGTTTVAGSELSAPREKTEDGTAEDGRALEEWDGPDDPDNPRTWSFATKWVSAGVASYYTFVAPLASSMLAPGLPALGEGYNTEDPTLIGLCLSIYILAFALGPLFLAPLSEMYGRRWVLHLSNLFFFAFLLACAWAPNMPAFIAFRFFAGLGGSAPLAIGGGVVADLFHERQRASAMAIYTLGPVLGPALGPVAGGFVAQHLGFRWISWILSILAGVGAILGIPLLRETYAPILLARRARKRDIEHGLPPAPPKDKIAFLLTSMVRPMKILFTSFVCFIMSLYMAIQYGFLYLLFTTFSELYTNVYGWGPGVSGLAFLGPGCGFFFCTVAAATLMDKIYDRLAEKNGGVGKPEFRIPVVIIGAVTGPIGLLLYGWTAQEHAHWILPIIGSGLFCCGLMLTFFPLQVYIIDTFQYAASALAAATVFRSLFGFAFPLFGQQMFDALGEGGGNSLLAGIAIVIGIPFPIWIWFKGEAIRQRSGKKL